MKQYATYKQPGEGHHVHVAAEFTATEAAHVGIELRKSPGLVALCGVSERKGGSWSPEKVSAKPDCGRCLQAVEGAAQIVALANFAETAMPEWLSSEVVAVENGKPSESAVLENGKPSESAVLDAATA